MRAATIAAATMVICLVRAASATSLASGKTYEVQAYALPDAHPCQIDTAARATGITIPAPHSSSFTPSGLTDVATVAGCFATVTDESEVTAVGAPGYAVQQFTLDGDSDGQAIPVRLHPVPSAAPNDWFALTFRDDDLTKPDVTSSSLHDQGIALFRGRNRVVLFTPAHTTAWLDRVNRIFPASPTRVSVSLSQPPTMRVRCSFDSDSGSHAEAEWDPAVPSGLVRMINLSPGDWQVSFWTEPITITQVDPSSSTTYVVSTIDDFAVALNGSKMEAAGTLTFQNAIKNRSNETTAFPPLRFRIAEVGLPETKIARKTISSPQGGVSGRSLQDTVPQPVIDFLQVLAQIAFDRAKAAAFQILTDRVIGFVCNDLVLPTNAVGNMGSATPSSNASSTRQPLLPKTCAVVRHTRIQDLASSAKALVDALFADLASFGMRQVSSRVMDLLRGNSRLKPWAVLLPPLFDELGPFATDLALGHTTLTGHEGQLLLVRLAQKNWFADVRLDDLVGDDADARPFVQATACGAELIFAIVGECQGAGGCDARAIADYVEHPKDHFKNADCFDDDKLPLLRRQWPDLSQMVSRALDVVFPPKTATPSTTLQEAVALLFDIISHIVVQTQNQALWFSADVQQELKKTTDAAATPVQVEIDAAIDFIDRDKADLNSGCERIGRALSAIPGAPPAAVVPALNAAKKRLSWIAAICAAHRNADATSSPKLSQAIGDANLALSAAIRDAVHGRAEQVVIDLNAGANSLVGLGPEDVKTIKALSSSLLEAIGKTSSSDARVIIDSLADLAKLMDGLVRRDAQPVLLAAASLINRAVQSFSKGYLNCEAIDNADTKQRCRTTAALVERLTQLVGAVTAYAQTYLVDAKGDQKLLDQQREARKKAVESLIDSATNRTNRDGDWVISIGASVGLSTGWQWLAQTGYQVEKEIYPQIELPMGVALEYLPDGRNRQCCWLKRHSGFHAQLSVIDLAQFVSYRSENNTVSKVTWSNFVMIGLQLGWIIGTPSTPFVLGVEGRWAPTLFTETVLQTDANGGPSPMQSQIDKGGAWRLGLFLSYYVPFFDFN